MPKCVYCVKDGSTTEFTKREHVVPACLGSFTPFNATIRGDVVCDECNSKFSLLETNFLEDSFEGVMSQRLNLQNRKSVTIRGRNFRVTQDISFGGGFFNEMFAFLKGENGRIVGDLRNQIKMRGFRDGHFRVFMLEALEELVEGSSKFQKLKREIGNLDPRGIAIFSEDQAAKERSIAQLRRFGINYTERESLDHRFEAGDRATIEHEMSVTIDTDIGRVLTKIAFNYFSYCAMEVGSTRILYEANFDAVRQFIHEGSGPLRSVITSINEEPILFDEAQRGMRTIAHVVTFREEEGVVAVRMSFFGAPAVYKIVLGRIPEGLRRPDFGCGHLFDPFSHRVFSLSQNPPADPLEEALPSFGLFRRVPNA